MNYTIPASSDLYQLPYDWQPDLGIVVAFLFVFAIVVLAVRTGLHAWYRSGKRRLFGSRSSSTRSGKRRSLASKSSVVVSKKWLSPNINTAPNSIVGDNQVSPSRARTSQSSSRQPPVGSRSRASQAKSPPLNWPTPNSSSNNQTSRMRLQPAYNNLVTRLQPIGDPRLLAKANELYEAFCALDPDVKQIQKLYNFFHNEPGRVPSILDDFRTDPAVAEIWRDAWHKALNKSAGDGYL